MASWWHKVGMSIPFSLATWSIVWPSSAVNSRPSILKVTILSLTYSIHLADVAANATFDTFRFIQNHRFFLAHEGYSLLWALFDTKSTSRAFFFYYVVVD